MEQWEIEGTVHTPLVRFDGKAGTLMIDGRSYPEEGLDFFEPILKRAEALSGTSAPLTVLHIRLEYYNSSTMKAISELIGKLKKAEANGHEIKLVWEYELDDEGIKDDIDMLCSAYSIEIEERGTKF